MSRYLLKFSKEKNLKYISHLDLLRLFLRAFKRADIHLRYSNGYNPHAKVSFALPLSLGFESEGEYLEFETEEELVAEEAAERLAANMPESLGILACLPLADTSKTPAAAALDFATYKVTYCGPAEDAAKLDAAVKPFLAQDEIVVTRLSKKKKKDVTTDIRPHIRSLTTVMAGDGRLIFSMMLATGSHGNLNAETLMEELCGFCGISYARADYAYRRMEMYFADGRDIRPLTEFKG